MALKKTDVSEKNDNSNELIRDAPVPEFYTNSISINVSPFEFEIQNLLVDSTRRIKGAVNIRMSPQTALTLAGALNKQLAEFEKQCGPIALPAELRKTLE